jgi:hypothetical protein
MHFRIIIFCLLSIFTLSNYSCKTEVTQRDDYKEVMKVHDEAMAKMGEMIELKNQIKSLKSTLLDTTGYGEADQLIRALESADEGMMVWMSEFRIPENAESAELDLYFKSEQKKVDIVSTDINTAIKKATEYLDNH